MLLHSNGHLQDSTVKLVIDVRNVWEVSMVGSHTCSMILYFGSRWRWAVSFTLRPLSYLPADRAAVALCVEVWLVLRADMDGRGVEKKLLRKSNNKARYWESIIDSGGKKIISSYFWPRGLRHELSSPAPTLRSWVRIPLRHGRLCVFCVRFFCFYIVSSETDSRPNKRLMRTYHSTSLFMSYIRSAN
jgi:hypothetical protein